MIAAYGLSKFFPIRGALRSTISLKAVDDVGLKIQNEQVVGLVGESGSGKSTVGRCLIRLLNPTEGEILFDIPDSELVEYERARADVETKRVDAIADRFSLLRASSAELQSLRRLANIVFQDPYSSLNPRMRLADIISEPFGEGQWGKALAIFMLAGIVTSVLMYSLALLAKWAFMGVYKPVMKPMWSWWAMRTEAVAVFYGGLASKVLLEYLRGTPFLPWLLRLFGSKIGRPPGST